uniref:RNA-directed DNA polymerase, eukaryota n=1 Tax=Tanacetum cinerariifolium TaxID=118510 RepID=A0A6L2M4G9_TANCI|nr:RNA-directed DNA polymerase, eukaryota [Tanacetum cinerariifolium]
MNPEEKPRFDDETGRVNESLYRSLIGRLIYVTHSRPDPSFTVGVLLWFMHNPSKQHFGVAKRVLRYLARTMKLGIWFREAEDFSLKGYRDSDYGGSVDDGKSSGQLQFLGAQRNKTRRQYLELIAKGEVKIESCRSEEQLADIMTKGLPYSKHEDSCTRLDIMGQSCDLVGLVAPDLQLLYIHGILANNMGSAFVGDSGGVLSVWDPNMFKKTNSTVSDFFVMVRGDWMPNDSWKDAPITESNALVRMMKKLKYLKEKIRMWNKLNKEKSHKSKRSLLAKLADCDAIIDKGERENNVVTRRTEVVNLLQEVKKKNSLEAAQKVKIKWAIEGDETPSIIMRFEQPNSNRLHMNMHFSNTLSSVQVADLECQVSKEEIKKAVWDCRIDKSPGPDGFTFGFYRRYWKLIENDIVDAILANRLVVVLGGLVNEIQSAFVADKQIFDGPFILNELVQLCKKKKKQSLVFKVDFEKAYDSVRWDHLDDIMRKFGFGEKWCMWIQSFLRSSRGSVIVNGSPTEEFQFYKGLKQGDPLSPFLFILVMESLHISLQRVVDVGLFKGIELAPSLNLSHMFYADDAIFMGQWSESNIDTIVKVLDCFNRASGLRINMTKSKLLGIYVEDDKVKHVAAKIGCNTLKTLFSYLGSKVGGCMSRIQSWNETIERMSCRLSKES